LGNCPDENVSRETFTTMPEISFISTFQKELEILGISYSETQIEQINQHYRKLTAYNKIINLTSIGQSDQAAILLFADSLIPLDYIHQKENARILELGSGGGFPSIPLKIFLPGPVSFTLVERRQKAAFFLEALVAYLNLENISILNNRIEELFSDLSFTNAFDFVLNKAAFQVKNFLEISDGFLKPGACALHWTRQTNITPDVPGNWNLAEIIKPPQQSSLNNNAVAVYQKAF
jgi:16S rRNA (guanine527-N7)-methyltransferase